MNTSFKISIIITMLIAIVIGSLSYMYKDELYIFYRDKILKERENINLTKNEYYKDNDYGYIQNTDKFIVENTQEIKNAIYTIINSGIEEFTFYCNDKYFTCINDIEEIVNDQIMLSSINNFVHPYNSFKELYASYDDHGDITLKIKKNYTEDEINAINNTIDEIINNELNNEMNLKNKIKNIHNYIINNGKYAKDEKENNNYSKANGILIDGYGTCNGYSDAMAIFLEKLKINNYKIASDDHIWNLVYFNNDWLHLDLTWDDPVNSDGSDSLETLFFLITDTQLNNLNVKMHDYDPNIYKEAKS